MHRDYFQPAVSTRFVTKVPAGAASGSAATAKAEDGVAHDDRRVAAETEDHPASASTRPELVQVGGQPRHLGRLRPYISAHKYGVAMEWADLDDCLRRSTTWWDLMLHLAVAWRDRSDPTQDPWEADNGAFDAFGQLLVGLEDDLGTPAPEGPTLDQIDLISRALAVQEDWRLAAAAYAVDRRCHAIFGEDWREAHPGAFTPEPGELYPVPSWEGPEGWDYSRSPTNFTVRPNEFPHVRSYEPEIGFTRPVEVVFDSSAEVELSAALTALSVLATVHPNREWAELSMSDGASAFPVRPAVEGQVEVVKAGVATSLESGAQVVVVPELALTQEQAADLCAWLEQVEPNAVVVAGSYHTEDDGTRANIADVVIGGSQRTPHRKIVPFTSERARSRPSREGIEPGPRRIHVYVCAGFRFAVVICKDFLDADVRHALARAGVNVVAVPAMSTSMESYPAEVDKFVLDTQGAGAIANNPAERHNGLPIQPAFVFGQPLATATHVAGPHTERAPFVSLFTLGANEARCIPLE